MPAESEWVVSWLISHALASRSPIDACLSQCDAIGRAWARQLAGLLVVADWAQDAARLLPVRPGSGGDSRCLVIAGPGTAAPALSCGWLGLVAHPVGYVL